MSDKPVYVPVAFPLEEAMHLLSAARAIIQSCPPAELNRAAPLAQAMMRLAEKTDEAKEKARAIAAT